MCLAILAFALTAQSQKKTSATSHAKDTDTQTTPKNKLDKAEEDVD